MFHLSLGPREYIHTNGSDVPLFFCSLIIILYFGISCCVMIGREDISIFKRHSFNSKVQQKIVTCKININFVMQACMLLC